MNKKFLMIFLIVDAFVLLIFLYFGYKWFVSGDNSINIDNPKPTIISSEQESINTDEFKTYIDPDNIYSIDIPISWLINDRFERGLNLEAPYISSTTFSHNEKYMNLDISKLNSTTPETSCRPIGGEQLDIEPLIIDNYTSYDSYKLYNLDQNYDDTSAYTYCFEIGTNKISVSFVAEKSINETDEMQIFYDILSSMMFQ
jgi:hypothetical protein